MSYRNRPVLDRKHRPRWQDELRTQQLIIAGFAVAIAVALGIFAATAWSDHYEGHLRPVASVGDATFDVDDLNARADIIASELQARYLDLQDQLGGMRDPLIQQVQQTLQTALQGVVGSAAESLVRGRALDEAAGRYGLKVADSAVTAELTKRETLKERLKLSLIAITALPKDAAAGAKPTDADWARAQGEIKDIVAQINSGADFAALAKEKSADASAAGGGALGWVLTNDQVFPTYFEEAHGAKKGALIGPIKDDTGYHILRLEDRHPTGPNKLLKDALASAGVSDASYVAYLRGELLYNAFSDYFSKSIVTQTQPAREVGQIFIAAVTGAPVPQQRIRHFLAQPLPGESDQSKATDAQWTAALARAQAFRAAAVATDADWLTLALTSDDPGSKSQGGDLGWYDPASSSFVAEFKAGIAALKVGEVGQPVKTQFGYHVIQITASRGTPGEEADNLLTTLRAHPDQFAKLARERSEDSTTAAKGGDLGWVIRYQLDRALSDAIFSLDKPNQISDVVQTTSGYYIFKLTDSATLRWVPAPQLTDVGQNGFARWLKELRDGANPWIDPQFSSASASG